MKINPASQRIEQLCRIYSQSPSVTDYVFYKRERRQKLNYMRAYIADEKFSTVRLRQAYADAYTIREMRPVIHDCELVVGLPDLSPLTEEEQREYDELSKCMRAAPKVRGLMGHKVLDFPKLLRVGVEGLLEEIAQRRAALDMNLPESLSKDEFYEGCEAELNALLDLEKKYAAHARALAAQAEPERAAELYEIADILDRVPAKPAQTFREAIQSIHFYRFSLWDLYYFGRLDQYLWPYYERDMREGRLTPELAQDLIDNFTALPEAYIVWESSTGGLLGGRTPKGEAVENELTWRFLASMEHTHNATGNYGITATEETSDEILRYAMALNAKGLTKPAIFNDDMITDALMRLGFPEEDARNYSNTGCVEITPNGKSGIYVVSPYNNLAKMLLEAMRTDVHSLDELYDAFVEILRRETFKNNLEQNRFQMERARVGGEVLRVSCLVDDCLARGKAVDEGGAVYNHTQPNFLGMANVIDSLVAVDHLVFRSGKYTLAQLCEILDNNYEGHEDLRMYIINRLPHFGQDEEETNAMARRLAKSIEEVCAPILNWRGVPLVPGAFSYMEHARHGSRTPATPDGRPSGYPLASGSSPVQGRETEGPTAAMLSATCWDQKPFLGGIAINMKFAPNQLTGEAQDRMLGFIRAFLKSGGMQMQFNAVSKDQLLEARMHPEEHEDLLVRIGGFSAYFTKLDPNLQQEIIDRNEHSV